MIFAEVIKEGQKIIDREYHEPGLTINTVIEKLERYVIDEQLNVTSECLVKAKYG